MAKREGKRDKLREMDRERGREGQGELRGGPVALCPALIFCSFCCEVDPDALYGHSH